MYRIVANLLLLAALAAAFLLLNNPNDSTGATSDQQTQSTKPETGKKFNF